MELLALLADTAEEGRNIILIMLVTGLAFVAVVLFGNWVRAITHRKHH